MYGVLEIRRNGRAPRSASVRRKARTFARYCALFGVHGVSTLAPNSSLSAISGLSHWLCVDAKSNSRFALSTDVARSAGAYGVPTRLLRYMSQ